MSQITALTARIVAAEQKLATALVGLQGDINNLKTQNAALAAQNATLTAEVAALQAQIPAAAEVTAMDAAVSTVEHDADTASTMDNQTAPIPPPGNPPG